MKKTTTLLSLVCIICGIVIEATAVEIPPPAAPNEVAKQQKPLKPGRSRAPKFPPEAYIIPESHLLIINHNNAVAPAWLEEERAHFQKQLNVNVKVANTSDEFGTDARAFALSQKAKADKNAKIILIITEDEDAPAIISAPYEYWAVMNSNWVKAGNADEATTNLRMGKRLFQTLGHCIGAGHRVEREACMRYTTTPEGMDDCLSHGFHPLNSNIFMIVQKDLGLQSIRLRPRDELIEMGLLPPRKKPAAAPAQ